MPNLKQHIRILRSQHYLKNLFIYLPLFFGLKFFNANLFAKVTIAFLAFSLAASAVYILNDYFDIEYDKQHPIKRHRPLAAEEISKRAAIFTIGGLLIASALISALVDINIFYLIAGYVILNVFYSLKLKHMPVIDVFVVAVGFIIRLFVGSEAAAVDLSMWIIMMTFLLALFLALAKRRDDVLLHLLDGIKSRKVIDGYNFEFLNAAIITMASIVVVAYIMYTVSPEEISKAHSNKLYMTSIFVIFGILRYMQIVFVENRSGSPTQILIKDRLIQLSILAWLIAFGIFLYL